MTDPTVPTKAVMADLPRHILVNGTVYHLCRNWIGEWIYLQMSAPPDHQPGRKWKGKVSYPAGHPPTHEVITAERADEIRKASLAVWEQKLRDRKNRTAPTT